MRQFAFEGQVTLPQWQDLQLAELHCKALIPAEGQLGRRHQRRADWHHPQKRSAVLNSGNLWALVNAGEAKQTVALYIVYATECRKCSCACICCVRGKVRLALLFLHGSGKPFEIEQRIFGPRAECLLSSGIALVLPASPLKDGKVHFWYSNSDLTEPACGNSLAGIQADLLLRTTLWTAKVCLQIRRPANRGTDTTALVNLLQKAKTEDEAADSGRHSSTAATATRRMMLRWHWHSKL